MTAVAMTHKPPKPSLLELDRIRIDGSTQPRLTISPATILEYGEAMLDGVVLPPLAVFFDGTDHWIGDGFHRVLGAGHAGIAEVQVEVRQGSLRDAQWHSFEDPRIR